MDIIKEEKNELTKEKKKRKGKKAVLLSTSEAETYLARSEKTYNFVGLGVWLILSGVASVIFFGGFGVTILFVTIAIAVMLFILSSSQMNIFEEIEDLPIRLDEETYHLIEQRNYRLRSGNTFKIALGVALILLAVGGIAGLGLNPGFLLLTIGFSTFLFITSGASMSTFDHLLSKGDYEEFANEQMLEYRSQALGHQAKLLAHQEQVINHENQISAHQEQMVNHENQVLAHENQPLSGGIATQQVATNTQSATKSTLADGDNDINTIKRAGNNFISELYKAKNLIANPKTLRDIDEIIDFTNKIIYRLEKEPNLIPTTRRLFDYYLPTTVKLVVNYGEVKKQGISGTNIDNMISNIEDALSNLTIAYKSQLEKLYLHTSVDLEAEIAALETMLKQEGLLSDGMNDITNTN
jgi:5-bromo-4-chloroindolyl phosphate hydrolysis protein